VRVSRLRAVANESEWAHFGTTGGRCGTRVSEEGRHVVVVEVDGVMGWSCERFVLIV
jgi:hypothetical protein